MQAPEAIGCPMKKDGQGCTTKVSEALQDVVRSVPPLLYSSATHGQAMLRRVNLDDAARRCPTLRADLAELRAALGGSAVVPRRAYRGASARHGLLLEYIGADGDRSATVTAEREDEEHGEPTVARSGGGWRLWIGEQAIHRVRTLIDFCNFHILVTPENRFNGR